MGRDDSPNTSSSQLASVVKHRAADDEVNRGDAEVALNVSHTKKLLRMKEIVNKSKRSIKSPHALD